MLKKSFIIAAIAVALIMVSVFVYRYQIMQYTAEALIRKYLPSYIKIDSIRFDFNKSDATLQGFKVLNPPEFSREYLIDIEKITCHYKMRGKTIIDGLELSSPILTNAVMDIERLGNGKMSLIEVQALIEGRTAPAVGVPVNNLHVESDHAAAAKRKRLLAPIKLPDTFVIKGGKVIFMDRMTRTNPNIITFDDIAAEVTIKMDESYTEVLSAHSTGQGNINGGKDQTVKWTVSIDPTTPRLTMSNRFEVSNVSIPPFEPYYDKYSPLVFKTGKFSGLLIFDFDNGAIGSSNELHLSDLQFFVKPGYENAAFWQTTVPDLVKYFTSPYGEIIFDFKIKGDMSDPKFYLGPRSKEAMISMVVDKISKAIQNSSGGGDGAPKNDIDKAKEYIDLFKGLIKK
jgi:hypothetical protein